MQVGHLKALPVLRFMEKRALQTQGTLVVKMHNLQTEDLQVSAPVFPRSPGGSPLYLVPALRLSAIKGRGGPPTGPLSRDTGTISSPGRDPREAWRPGGIPRSSQVTRQLEVCPPRAGR